MMGLGAQEKPRRFPHTAFDPVNASRLYSDAFIIYVNSGDIQGHLGTKGDIWGHTFQKIQKIFIAPFV